MAVTDVLPPQMFMATVQDDGYFADDLYDELDAARSAAEHRDG